MHRAQDVFFVSCQADIDWIGRDILCGAGQHRQPGQALLVFVMRPRQRQRKIGNDAVDNEEGGQNREACLQL
jgi:hypothetical protein